MTTENPPDPSKEPDTKPPLSSPARLVGLIWTFVALVTVFSFWQLPYTLNLVSSFRFHLVLALSVASIPALFCFKGRQRIVVAGVTLLMASTFLSYWLPASPPGERRVTVAVANVYSGNHDLGRLKAWIEAHPVDVLGVLEVAPDHQEQLEKMGFEHFLIRPRRGNFGIALLYNGEAVTRQVLEPESPFPSIIVEFPDYIVLLTHPVPPINPEFREAGDRQVERLASMLAEQSKPVVVMGDLNATVWDRRTQPLTDLSLKDSRQGFGLLPTWPTYRWWMQIPIDHILIPGDWGVAECQRGPDIGSDHFPLRAVVGPREGPI